MGEVGVDVVFKGEIIMSQLSVLFNSVGEGVVIPEAVVVSELVTVRLRVVPSV